MVKPIFKCSRYSSSAVSADIVGGLFLNLATVKPSVNVDHLSLYKTRLRKAMATQKQLEYILFGLVDAADWTNVDDLIKNWNRLVGKPMDIIVWHKLLHRLTSEKEPAVFIKYFDHFKAAGHWPGPIAYTSLMLWKIKHRDFDEFSQVYSLIQNPDEIARKTYLTGLLTDRKPSMAFDLFQEILEIGNEVDIANCNHLIRHYASFGDFSTVQSIIRQINLAKIKLSEGTLTNAILGARSIDEIEWCIENIPVKLSQEHFTAMLSGKLLDENIDFSWILGMARKHSVTLGRPFLRKFCAMFHNANLDTKLKMMQANLTAYERLLLLDLFREIYPEKYHSRISWIEICFTTLQEAVDSRKCNFMKIYDAIVALMIRYRLSNSSINSHIILNLIFTADWNRLYEFFSLMFQIDVGKIFEWHAILLFKRLSEFSDTATCDKFYRLFIDKRKHSRQFFAAFAIVDSNAERMLEGSRTPMKRLSYAKFLIATEQWDKLNDLRNDLPIFEPERESGPCREFFWLSLEVMAHLGDANRFLKYLNLKENFEEDEMIDELKNVINEWVRLGVIPPAGFMVKRGFINERMSLFFLRAFRNIGTVKFVKLFEAIYNPDSLPLSPDSFVLLLDVLSSDPGYCTSAAAPSIDNLLKRIENVLNEECGGFEFRKESVYLSLINYALAQNRVSEANKILSKMLSEGGVPGPNIFASLLKWLAYRGEVDASLQLTRVMDHFTVRPTRYICELMVKMLLNSERLDLALEWILKSSKSRFNDHVSKDLCADFFRRYYVTHSFSECSMVAEQLVDAGYNVDPHFFLPFLERYLDQQNDLKKARKYFNKLMHQKLTIPLHLYLKLLRTYLSEGRIEGAYQIHSSMKYSPDISIQEYQEQNPMSKLLAEFWDPIVERNPSVFENLPVPSSTQHLNVTQEIVDFAIKRKLKLSKVWCQRISENLLAHGQLEPASNLQTYMTVNGIGPSPNMALRVANQWKILTMRHRVEK